MSNHQQRGIRTVVLGVQAYVTAFQRSQEEVVTSWNKRLVNAGGARHDGKVDERNQFVCRSRVAKGDFSCFCDRYRTIFDAELQANQTFISREKPMEQRGYGRCPSDPICNGCVA